MIAVDIPRTLRCATILLPNWLISSICPFCDVCLCQPRITVNSVAIKEFCAAREVLRPSNKAGSINRIHVRCQAFRRICTSFVARINQMNAMSIKSAVNFTSGCWYTCNRYVPSLKTGALFWRTMWKNCNALWQMKHSAYYQTHPEVRNERPEDPYGLEVRSQHANDLRR